MKTLKSTSFLLILFLACIHVFPQYGNVNGRQSNANFEANLAANNMMRGRDLFQDVLKKGENSELNIEDIEGNAFFNEIFAKGILLYRDSLNLGEFLMRYNAFTDEMEVSNTAGNNILSKVDEISILLENEKYVVLNYEADTNTIKKGFFIEKNSGSHNRLFLKKSKTIKQGTEAKTSFHKSSPPSFVDHEDYFLKFGNNAPVEVKLKKNKILNAFPDKYDILKKYVSKENLKLETEQELILLSKYYNTLD